MDTQRAASRSQADRSPAAGPLRCAAAARRLSLAAAFVASVVGFSGARAADVAPAAHAQLAAQGAAQAHPSRAFWRNVAGVPAQLSSTGAKATVSVRGNRLRAAMLDRSSITSLTSTAPLEATRAARLSPLVVSLPDPNGGFQRFAVAESPVMEPALAARHPEIKTYAGRSLDEPGATIRMDITPLGLHASVRSPKGAWYIDPYYHLDDSVYASYYARDLINVHGTFAEAMQSGAQLFSARGLYHAADKVVVNGIGFAPGAQIAVTVQKADAEAAPRQTVYAVAGRDGALSTSVVADPYRALGSYTVTATDGRTTATLSYQVISDAASPNAAVGGQLRTYRLALVTDPSYAAYFGGSANVTAAKVSLINRVTQIYESETSIRMVLIGSNDVLNFDSTAQMTGVNGPCGGAACYTAAQVASCGSGTLSRNRQVIGLLVGASNYDIGHIALGVNGGGIASLGVVGGNSKAQGCTGIPTPVGDAFAVDYVAHEMGHQFSGNHTFNGAVSNCSTSNRNANTSVEPGSGSSIMAYAGICGSDDLQPHSDAYWSQRSFDEITAYTSAAETAINEVQLGVLTGFVSAGASQTFQLSYGGSTSAPIGTATVPYTIAGVKAAIEAIPSWPSGATVTVSALTDNAFTVTFGGTLAGVNASMLQLVNCAGCTGFVGEVAKGGPTTKNGTVTATGNSAPAVTTAAASYTIPIRTPFALTGSATDVDSDTVTYMWEQNDRGASTAVAPNPTNGATGLITQPKPNGPLFRQFGTRVVVTTANSLLYNSPGENTVTTNPTRVFPDMAQILANNTNAETGTCTPVPVTTPATAPTPAQIDCFSEFLPTAEYVGVAGVNASPPSLNFRLTARDGRGGVNSATTQLVLEPTAGPFLVTSPNTAVTVDGTSVQTVTWSVANTNVAPVGTANVKITLSTDGGATFGYTLAASAPNNGSATVAMPNVGTTTARVKVEAVGNVFFDVSNADFAIRLTGDVNGDGVLDCADLAIVRASFGKRTGDAGFDARADVVKDGVVNVRDLAYVSSRLPATLKCS